MESSFIRGANFNRRVNFQHVRGSLYNDFSRKRSLFNVENWLRTVEKWPPGSLFNVDKWPCGLFFNRVNFQRYTGKQRFFKVDFRSRRWTTNFQRWYNVIDFNVGKTTHFNVVSTSDFNVETTLDFNVEITSYFNVETTSDFNVETSYSNRETTSDFNVETTSYFNVETTSYFNVDSF